MTRHPRLVTCFRLAGQTLLIDLEKQRKVLSSASCRGGLVRARYILNHQVQANPVSAPAVRGGRRHRDPAKDLRQIALDLGADGEAVALMTAVPLKQLVTLREEADGLWVEGFFTVGVTNAVRAGEPIRLVRDKQIQHASGTINIILVTNAGLSPSAMVGVVQVATESKTAALLAAKVPSWSGRSGATGTGTDAVVVVSGRRNDGPMLRYSGTHTRLGELVGKLVARGVKKGLVKSKRWSKRRPSRHSRGSRWSS